MINKTFSIIGIFYLKYLLLFLFDNIINHFIYANNALCTTKINKKRKKNKYSCIINSIKKMKSALNNFLV